MKEKICVVVDSGSDLSNELIGDLDIISLPLRVIIDNKEFIDNQTISREEIFAALIGNYENLSDAQKANISSEELVEGQSLKITTSLPTPEDILNTYNKLKDEGYTHIIGVSISSGLSGTYNTMTLLRNEVEAVVVETIDTKNISLGSGYVGLAAAKLVKEGKSFKEIIKECDNLIKKSKVFFSVGSLDYLQRGGRIGLVGSSVANLLNIKPIISCNEDGVYYTVKKGRGYRKVLSQMIDIALEFVENAKDFRIEIVNADSKEDINSLINDIKSRNILAKDINIINITPALAIHTGPEAIGIAVFINE